MSSLQGKVVLITGVGGGQGREAALRFTAAGAHVIGCDISVEASQATEAAVREAGGSIVTMHPVDLVDPKAAGKWVADAAAVHGRIDVLYNNAANARFGDFETFPLEDWHFTINSELNSVFYVTRAAWPYLKKSGGVLLNIASTAGIRGSGPGGAAHAASKAGVIGFTKHMALEGAPYGIRVVSISPGIIETPGFLAYAKAHPADAEALLAKNMIRRIGKPSDIVALALLLCSDEGGYITGENIVVDGGRTRCTQW